MSYRSLFSALILVVAIAALTACDRVLSSEPFSLVSAASGETYRINRSSGEIHKIHGSLLISISETDRIELAPGNVYVFEDGSQNEYVGNGEFKPFEGEVLTLGEFMNTISEE